MGEESSLSAEQQHSIGFLRGEATFHRSLENITCFDWRKCKQWPAISHVECSLQRRKALVKLRVEDTKESKAGLSGWKWGLGATQTLPPVLQHQLHQNLFQPAFRHLHPPQAVFS